MRIAYLPNDDETIRAVRIGGGMDRDNNKMNELMATPYPPAGPDAWGAQITMRGEDGPRIQVWFHHDEVLQLAAALIVIIAQQEEERSKHV